MSSNNAMKRMAQPSIMAPTNQQSTTDDPVRFVHIIDDDEPLRSALQALILTRQIGAACYRSAEHFLSLYRPRKIECILLDLLMPGMSGFELQQVLRSRHIRLPIIAMSAYIQTEYIVRSVQNGAIDFLEKPIEEHSLFEKIDSAHEMDTAMKKLSSELNFRINSLSEREHEVMGLLIDAKSTMEISHQLSISPKTVEKHRVKIFAKMRVDSVPELMRQIFGAEHAFNRVTSEAVS